MPPALSFFVKTADDAVVAEAHLKYGSHRALAMYFMNDVLFEPVRDLSGEIGRWSSEEASRVAAALELMEADIRKTPQGVAIGCLQALKDLQEIYENGLAGAVSDAGRRELEAVLQPVREERAVLEAGMKTAPWFEGMDLLARPGVQRCLAFLAELRAVCAAATRENLPIEIVPD